MMTYEIPRPGVESTCPDHQAVADVDSESNKGYPAAKQNRTKPKHLLKRSRRRYGKAARDTRPDITSLMTELRQINDHLGQLLDKKKRQEGNQAQMLRGTWADDPRAPVTSTELYSGGCFLHDKWYSGFDTKIREYSKTYFLAIAGAEWRTAISVRICDGFFNLGGNRIQVDDQLEIIDYFKAQSLGPWDQHALSPESIVHSPEENRYRYEWNTRQNLGEIREALDADWSEGLLRSRGRVFYLYTPPLSFNYYKLDALVFIEADVAYPELRCLRVHLSAFDEDKYYHLYQSFEPEDDPRPVIGHIWYVLSILVILSCKLTPCIGTLTKFATGHVVDPSI